MGQASLCAIAPGKHGWRPAGKAKIILLPWALCLYHTAAAQRLSGKVTDRETGAALGHVTVTSLAAGDRAQTDASGNFTIRVRGGDTIRFQLLGYTPRTILLPDPAGATPLRLIALSQNISRYPKWISTRSFAGRIPECLPYAIRFYPERICFGNTNVAPVQLQVLE